MLSVWLEMGLRFAHLQKCATRMHRPFYSGPWRLWIHFYSWWRHQMEAFSALLAICAGNSPVPGEFPTQRPVTRSFDVYFDLRRINGWVNNREAGDLRRYSAHYDVIVMYCGVTASTPWFWATVVYISAPFYQIARTAAIWTIVLVGVHRYIVGCKPLMATRLCSVGRTRRHLFGLLLFAVIINLPFFFRFVVKEVPGQKDIYNPVRTNMEKSPWYVIVYNLVFCIIVLNYIIPMGCLIFITVRLLQSLRSSRKRRVELIEGQRQGQTDNRLECMVIVVFFVFLVCHTGIPILVLLHTSGVMSPLEYSSYDLTQTLTVFNSSVNIFIYIGFNQNFRRTLCLCLKSPTRRRNNQQTT